jgi:hypothetical protein
MITITALQAIENQLAKKQNRKACEIRAGVFPKTFMPVIAMYNRLESEIIFNKGIVYDTPEVEAIITLVHESRHAYQWDRINHPKKAIESKALLDQWKQEFENFSLIDPNQNEDKYLKMAIEIDAIAYTHITMLALTEEKTVIPNIIKEAVETRIGIIRRDELPLYQKA